MQAQLHSQCEVEMGVSDGDMVVYERMWVLVGSPCKLHAQVKDGGMGEQG